MPIKAKHGKKITIYTVERDGTRSVLDFSDSKSWERIAGTAAVWAAEISVGRDGEEAYAVVEVVRGSDMDQHYEDAKSYVQDNLI